MSTCQDDRRIFLAEQHNLHDRIQTRLRHKGDDTMPTETERYCVNCAHATQKLEGGAWYCAAGLAATRDKVTGELIMPFCSSERTGLAMGDRGTLNLCGSFGRNFQPKQTAP